jgi:hypothetical protein
MHKGGFNRLLKNFMSAGKTRQNPTKKRSLCAINEHFEEDFNAVFPSVIGFQQPVKALRSVFLNARLMKSSLRITDAL